MCIHEICGGVNFTFFKSYLFLALGIIYHKSLAMEVANAHLIIMITITIMIMMIMRHISRYKTLFQGAE